MNKMRLREYDINAIKKTAVEIFGSVDIYLFGSRVFEHKRGGDIDLYLDPKERSNLFEKKIKFLSSLKRKIGDRKIDIVFKEDPARLIEQEAMVWGIRL